MYIFLYVSSNTYLHYLVNGRFSNHPYKTTVIIRQQEDVSPGQTFIPSMVEEVKTQCEHCQKILNPTAHLVNIYQNVENFTAINSKVNLTRIEKFHDCEQTAFAVLGIFVDESPPTTTIFMFLGAPR